MSWNLMPPASGSHYTFYEWAQQFPAALRERYGITSTVFDDYNWPHSTRVWASGRVTGIEDNEDGTLKVTCEILDTDGVTWIAPDWVSPRHSGMDAGTKWWTNYTPPTSPDGGF